MVIYCDCPERPRCMFHGCDHEAGWSYLHPAFPRSYQEHFRFACDYHFQRFMEFENAAWQPSLLEMIRQANLALEYEDRKPVERYSPQQKATLDTLRQNRAQQ